MPKDIKGCQKRYQGMSKRYQGLPKGNSGNQAWRSKRGIAPAEMANIGIGAALFTSIFTALAKVFTGSVFNSHFRKFQQAARGIWPSIMPGLSMPCKSGNRRAGCEFIPAAFGGLRHKPGDIAPAGQPQCRTAPGDVALAGKIYIHAATPGCDLEGSPGRSPCPCPKSAAKESATAPSTSTAWITPIPEW